MKWFANAACSCICPGVFPSRMSKLFSETGSEAMLTGGTANFGMEKYSDTLLERQPTGRVGKPEDLAGLIIYLSTMAGAHSVGECSCVNTASDEHTDQRRKRHRARWRLYTIWLAVIEEGQEEQSVGRELQKRDFWN